jgi:mannobiose 2-epimerase
MAAACLKFLREKMWDKEHGGYYFMVSREGKVVDSTKQLNPMSYTMEGLAEYALAFHDNQAAREALDLFQVIDRHAHDDKYGGYRIAFTADWQFIKDYKDGPNGAGSFGRKSYDWHLGLVEALATLYDVTGDRQVRARLEELLDVFVNKIIDPDIGYGRYYFHDDWSVADRDGDSKESEYGLDLEASWLITEAAERVGRQRDPAIRRASLALVDHALRYGTRSTEASPRGPRRSRQKHGHGMVATVRGLVGLLNAYQLTGIRSTGKPSILKAASSCNALWTINSARSTPPFLMTGKSTTRKLARGKPRTMSPVHVWRLSRDWVARCSADGRRARTPVAPLTT